MKSDFHFHFYSRIVIMAVLAVSLIFIQKSVRSNAEIVNDPYSIGGWAWAASAGWLSLNCYNDFITPGEYVDRCERTEDDQWPDNSKDYALKVNQSSGDVTGCAWAGNALNNNGDPLGWVCFSDQSIGGGPEAIDGFGVTISIDPNYLNALDQNTFASILNQEDWTCVNGDNPGDNCSQNANPSDCLNGGVCTFAVSGDNEAWKLGFPILSIANGDPDATDIEGCFNCYEEYEYECSVTGAPCTQENEDTDCPNQGSESEIPQTCSVITAINKNCDNCLEYFYYEGACSTSGNSCKNNDDCTITETCEPINTCLYDTEQVCDPTLDPGLCSGGAINCIEREVGLLKKLIGGYDCTSCNIESYSNVCGINTYQGNINSCESCALNFYSPGVMIDHKHYNLAEDETATMCGWAWNAWDEDGDNIADYGLGWFQFGPRVVTSTKPYLAIEGGNIYSKGDIRGRYLPPFGRFNASYLIESGGSITNFVSNSTLTGSYQGEFSYRPIINFPSFDIYGEQKYTNALGNIDFYGLITDFSGANLDVNKYGSKIHKFNDNTFSINNPMGGEVYYYTNGLTLDNSTVTTIPVGDETIFNASGVIAVEGDLTIRRNIEYGTPAGSYANLKNIPSLVWLVKGDLIIDSAVTALVGTFVVLGDDTSCNPLVSGCGQIITCDDSVSAIGCETNSLTIQGNVLARYFDLGRLFADPDGQASEKFINDGHIQANPPPGFEDFSNVIPRFTDN